MEPNEISNLAFDIFQQMQGHAGWEDFNAIEGVIKKVNNTIKDICAKDREFSILCCKVGLNEIVTSVIGFFEYETINEEFFNLSRKEVKDVVRTVVAL